jgi:hypothetical protein
VISRRHLIGSGMAMSALGLFGRAVNANRELYPGNVPFAPLVAGKVIVDTRFSEALEIARATAAPGARIIPLPRDVFELWYDELAPSPPTAPQPFAGVTTEHGFFTLRTLAADHRLRVLDVAEHAARRGGEPLVSWVIGAARTRA